MKDELKTKKQLINELAKLRKRLSKLEAPEIKRKSTEKALKESEKKYRDMVENINEVIYSADVNGVITYMSPVIEKYGGYSLSEIVGRHFKDFIYPGDMLTAMNHFQKHLSGIHETFDIRIQTKSGEVLWVHVNNKPILKDSQIIGFHGVLIDITERKRIESRLFLQYDITHTLSESKNINETMEKILQVVCERNGWEIGEIWFIDEKTDTLRLNSLWHQPSLDITEFKSISKETTFKKGEGLPGRVWENGHPEWIIDVAGNKDFLRESIASKTGIHCAFAFPIKSSGRVLGIFTFFSRKIELRDNDFLQMLDALGSQIGDFIERKHAEEELKRYSEELEKRVKERTKDLEEAKVFAEIANRVKSDFLMNMSHELKTPLNSIIGFSEIMIDGILGDMTDQQRGNLKNIYESGKHLFSLINDILEISRIDAGLTEIESNKFSLRKSCESIMEKFRDKSIKRNIELKVEIEEELTDIIADERKIKYVVFNFLDNAIKFTPDGGSVLLKARQISDFGLRISELKEAGKIFLTENGKFSFTIPQSAIEIAAEDTGIGISPEDQKRLFQPFHQLEPTLTKRYPGIGLGLYLSKRCIELQSGVIWVESETGKGSRFNFAIPIMD